MHRGRKKLALFYFFDYMFSQGEVKKVFKTEWEGQWNWRLKDKTLNRQRLHKDVRILFLLLRSELSQSLHHPSYTYQLSKVNSDYLFEKKRHISVFVWTWTQYWLILTVCRGSTVSTDVFWCYFTYATKDHRKLLRSKNKELNK